MSTISAHLSLGLLTSIGDTLDAFFVEIVEEWERQGARVSPAAGTQSSSFPHQRLLPHVTRSPKPGNALALKELRAWAKEERLDAIITNTANASTLVRLARVNAPVIYFCHGLHWNGAPRVADRIFVGMEQSMLRSTAAIVCINNHDDAWFAEHASSKPRLRLIHGVGLNTHVFARRAPRSWSPADGHPMRIVWVGEMSERKNPFAMIALAAELNARAISFQIDMLGDGEFLERMRRDATPSTNIKLHGRTSPREFFEQADVLVQTSHWEGLPRVALEALAVGLPTVGFDVKGVSDVPHTVVVPEGNIEALADVTVSAARTIDPDLPPLDALSSVHAATSLLQFAHDVASGRIEAGEYRAR
ncbi:MAG: glycosyltransferase [Ancrocorticia sp.]|uniref:glycosyltransferase n=1 Tax=Ancrocorticia sp. TaxID=2593684 RepID=UPI003F926CFD